jgi:hypothetical protein
MALPSQLSSHEYPPPNPIYGSLLSQDESHLYLFLLFSRKVLPSHLSMQLLKSRVRLGVDVWESVGRGGVGVGAGVDVLYAGGCGLVPVGARVGVQVCRGLGGGGGGGRVPVGSWVGAPVVGDGVTSRHL